jgi:hypothetical protein
MQYSGIEIAMSNIGTLRARVYPTGDYKDNFNGSEWVKINYCPMCAEKLSGNT